MVLDENEADDSVNPPAPQIQVVGSVYNEDLPEVVDLQTILWYDQSLLNHFGGNDEETKGFLRRVVESARHHFADPSLGVYINIVIIDVDFIDQDLRATHSMIHHLAEHSPTPYTLNSFFCFDNSGDTVRGIAFIGTACRHDGYAVNINEYGGDEESTARIFAHEIGHNLGI